MNDLFVIACGAGLQDGLNPCVFITCSFFIAHGLWLEKYSLRLGGQRVFFVLIYALGLLVFNFGPLQGFLFNKYFIIFDKTLYFVLGIGAFILGVVYFKDWVLLRRTAPLEPLHDEKKQSLASGSFTVPLLTVVLAVLLSALATFWPVNNYIILLTNAIIAKGQWEVAMPILLGYVFCSIWPLLIVWAFLSVKNLQPSLLKIVCSAICFTASSMMILIFK